MCLLQLCNCYGAGNFHWVKVAQAELRAVVAGNPHRDIECRTFDALDGCMQVNHRCLGVCLFGPYFLSVTKSNHHWGRVENFPVRNEMYTANATENRIAQATRMVVARSDNDVWRSPIHSKRTRVAYTRINCAQVCRRNFLIPAS